ncbi:NACHT, LRR and PYD domains-containing protein 12-like isoform X3 [Carassius auratus]|uniref:NACHT, LRR and PYD domains-containing protein 12-like isoform X3 n=1 Tax=Carassius auratus TaxID=7957 RepID=A0A6P6PJX0_CARAU|nr:NACHT, LRR and PYD domains-containing protein 12-like isoform X3 [Carassius auratus]
MENRESRTERSSSPDLPLNLSDEPVTSDLRISWKLISSSPDHSCVSLKSDASMGPPPLFSDDPVTSDPRSDGERSISGGVSSVFCLNNTSVTASLNKHDQAVKDELQRVKEQHKTSMKNKYERLCEGLKLQENESLLNSIYTQLYIIEGEREGVNEEHEVLQMEKTARTQPSQDAPIYCNDIFKASAEAGSEEKEQIKTVLTKGIAGIGKTVSVQKFILDWAEGKANQDVDFMFVLPFRELNLIRDHPYSLHRLLLDFHPELQDLDSQIYEECKVVFIFDGLDESRITLMFSDAQKVCDVTETSSVAVLMSKLMKGELLPSALIWITSRPAAANQIPSKYIHRLTEIQGFTEPQKEEYFRKRISDEHQASRIISHIRRARSLHIMCHIPVFCWISSTVLQKLLEEDLRAEIPQTLTEMYIHFLLIQINMRKQKYEERDPEKLLPSNREVIVKLAEVAFKQLMKGNVMFYEEDLIESGIDVTDASVYSGICTEIFKQEPVINQRKVYSFIHLSVQEFLAAFYEFYCYVMKNKEPVDEFRCDFDEDPLYDQTSEVDNAVDSENEKVSLYNLLTSAVDKAVDSKNGHLDLFLRFLLGVSLESNQRLLQDLLTHTENSSETIRETTLYIKMKIRNDGVNDYFKHPPLSVGESINLFLCLLEVKDQTLFREIQEFVKSDKHSEKLSPAQCSTISYMLQMSEETLDEFEFKKYNTSDEGRRRLIPAVTNCRKALFSGCNLTAQCCESLSSALQSSNCVLRELDLRNNDLQDSGVKIISDGLKSQNCQLQKLSLAGCNLTAQCCKSLSSALQSSNCVLRELDLRNNHLQDSGVKIISDGLKSQNCQLQKLSLAGCYFTDQCCESLSSALQSSNCVLRELDLRNNDLQDSGVKIISDGLKSQNCQLQKLSLAGCKLTAQCCESLSSALQSSNCVLRELDLRNNRLQDSGVKIISDGLKSQNCQLQKLSLAGCYFTAQCCESLSSALQSSNCVLRELDLRNNDLQDSGVKIISDGLKRQNCQLQKLSLAGCKLTAQCCESLSSALQSSNCVLRELDLRNNHLQDSGVKFISDGLKSQNCQLQKLSLAGCNLTAQCCESLSSALQSSNCVLRELDLSNSDLQDSGVKIISDGLKRQNCQLQKLSLAGCNLTAQCCESLSSALQSSNCVLRELDLRNNRLRDSGVKIISDGLKSQNCQLQKLRLSGCMVSEEGCGYLSSALSSNPSHLRELDLSYNHPGPSGVQLLKHRLEDSNYTLKTLSVDHGREIRMRAGLRKYACDLTLDPNTAHSRLVLSDGNKKIRRVFDRQPYPDHPERFDDVPQVLSVESLTGRCYWETEWSGSAVISVSYKGINRKGGWSDDCVFGNNDKSWSLECFDDEFTVCHNNNRTVIPAVHSSCNIVRVYYKRVGVYVDVSAGVLSFYSVSDTHTHTHIHTINTTFTEPLYAGFGVNNNSSVSLCDIKT